MNNEELHSTFIETQFVSITTFNLRFSHHVMKIEENLYAFINIMEEPKEVIDSTILQREKRIRIEFSRRFTRDYLYPIQLKMKELENEYLAFLSKKNCKIAQSMILRPLVLTVMKKLSNSTQIYLQFLRNNKSKVFVKLKEILNMITHSFEITKSIVDHQILKNTNIENLCVTIINISRSQSLVITPKYCNTGEKIRKKNNTIKNVKRISQKSFVEPKKDERIENEKEICDHHILKNVSFSHISYSLPTKKIPTVDSVAASKNSTTNNRFSLHSSISEFSSRISDLILNELLVDIVSNINEVIEELALNVFNLEFSDGD